MIENYIKPNFFRLELEKCTTEQLQKFINSIKKETTRGKIYQKIKKVFFKAYVTGKIKHDITLGLEKPKQKNKQIRSPMTLEEQRAFVNEAKKSKIYAFCMFSLIIGSRREETLKFDISKDLDEAKQTIHIRGTKTDNADREVKVTQCFIDFLKANMKRKTFDMHPTTATKKTKDIFRREAGSACLIRLHGVNLRMAKIPFCFIILMFGQAISVYRPTVAKGLMRTNVFSVN